MYAPTAAADSAARPVRRQGEDHRDQPRRGDDLTDEMTGRDAVLVAISNTRRSNMTLASTAPTAGQITTSQRALACCSACFQRAPGRIPVCGSTSK